MLNTLSHNCHLLRPDMIWHKVARVNLWSSWERQQKWKWKKYWTTFLHGHGHLELISNDVSTGLFTTISTLLSQKPVLSARKWPRDFTHNLQTGAVHELRFMSLHYKKTSEIKEKEKGSEERAFRNVCATYASTRSATSCSLVRGSSSFFNSSLDSFRMLPLLSSLLNFLFLLSSP